MAGSIAQPFYGVPQDISGYCYGILTPELRGILNNFEKLVGMQEKDAFFLQRFIEAQDNSLTCNVALKEIQEGRKQSHWVWYIFPQLKGLGSSTNSLYYGLVDIEEAEAYLAHPILGSRLREITKALLNHCGKDITLIMGEIDAIKLCSSMTLFDVISPNDVFSEVLKAFYESKSDKQTLQKLNK